jgi:O-acetyl-ADP-ribose deacetylase (regulator of RNase III)
MIIEIKPHTDIFTLDVDAFAHGCNCMGLMGAGIALQFRLRYPDMYLGYKQFCKNLDYDKIMGGMVYTWFGKDVTIFNLMTQHQPGRHAKLQYVEESFKNMFYAIKIMPDDKRIKSLAIPAIGCGIGGLQWDEVFETIIQTADKAEIDDLTLYIAFVD